MKSNFLTKALFLPVVTSIVLSGYAENMMAAGFAAMVSPPRFEMKGKSGDVLKGIVEIQNADDVPNTYALRTADWELNEQGGVNILPAELQSGSCRPWAKLERHRVRLMAQGLKRYRFEIHIPEDVEDGECRLALLLESAEDQEPVMASAGDVRFPIQGRIAVIIYVAVGEAKPDLKMETVLLEQIRGMNTPVIVLSNQGNAHGRPAGILEATDKTGTFLEFNVSPSPILPGETRAIPIWQATIDGEPARDFTPPITLKGIVEWEGGEQKIDTVLTQQGPAPLSAIEDTMEPGTPTNNDSVTPLVPPVDTQ